MSKAAVIVLADVGTEEGLGRVYNALSTVRELKEAGDPVRLYFDGAGARWIAELSKPEHIAHGLFEGVRDVVGGFCGGCGDVFGASQAAELAGGTPARETVDGQISYRKLLHEGYQILTF